jgi:hypothetical protein
MIKEKVAIGLVNSRRLKSILRIWNVNLRRNYSDMVKQWKSSKKIILATSVVFCWCNCIDLLAIDYEAVSVMHFTNTYRSCKCESILQNSCYDCHSNNTDILGILIYSPSECLWIVI